ncbi:MAG: copper resistance protein NlpE N-terminal domain-containing protein [Bacteroidota bacterium]
MNRFLKLTGSLAVALPIGLFIAATGTSCNSRENEGEVTVDTVDTDFFEQLNAANAVKFYEGILPCADCPGVLTTLRIHEDSLTYRLKQEYLVTKGKSRTTEENGAFTRALMQDGIMTMLSLKPNGGSTGLGFQTSGDTLLILLDSDGMRPVVGKNNSLKRR